VKKGDTVEVVWIDAVLHSGILVNPEEAPGALAITKGSFLNQDDSYIRLYFTDYGVQGVTDIMVIPLSLLVGEPRLIEEFKDVENRDLLCERGCNGVVSSTVPASSDGREGIVSV
jgi:hypothetical protein